MAHDEHLASRIRALLAGEAGVTEKRMFGGLAFLVDGHMSVAASGQGGLLVRVDTGDAEALADQPHAAPMVMRGRPMDGWLRVAPEGVAAPGELERWVARGLACARALPAKG